MELSPQTIIIIVIAIAAIVILGPILSSVATVLSLVKSFAGAIVLYLILTHFEIMEHGLTTALVSIVGAGIVSFIIKSKTGKK